jgi:hypothetical protein
MFQHIVREAPAIVSNREFRIALDRFVELLNGFGETMILEKFAGPGVIGAGRFG